MLMKYKLTVFSSRNTRLYIALFLHITDFPLNVYNCYKFMPPTVFFFGLQLKFEVVKAPTLIPQRISYFGSVHV